MVADIDDANTGSGRKQLNRTGDLSSFAAMMQAHIAHPNVKNAVARACREQLKKIVNLNHAVRYLVALGKRGLLWELILEQIERNVVEVTADAQ